MSGTKEHSMPGNKGHIVCQGIRDISMSESKGHSRSGNKGHSMLGNKGHIVCQEIRDI